jgi:hypothetical protein
VPIASRSLGFLDEGQGPCQSRRTPGLGGWHLGFEQIEERLSIRIFDTAQMPLNVMDAHYRSFEKLNPDGDRVPPLRAEPAGLGRHHRL